MNIDNKNLRDAQLIMLETLIEVDRVCKKHNIKYWLDSGTLLGAIRHKGFIPWDDDLDIAMTIEDYNKFCQLAPNELSSNLELQIYELDKNYPYDCAKIRNSKGKIIEKHEVGKRVIYNQAIFIDIFPSITIKNSKLHKILYKFNFLAVKLFSYKYLNIGAIRRILVKVSDKLHQGFNCKKCKVIRSAKMPSYKLYVDIDTIFPLKQIEFEGKKFFAPSKSAIYLKTLYGKDYMQLPPKDKRLTHSEQIEIYEKANIL